jgi:nicotinamide riboside kinase
LRTIVLTGPESTGKTMISAWLAEKLGCPWIPEYARDYIGSLDRPYTYPDLVHILSKQIHQKDDFEKKEPSILILDTWLIITKVWFLEVFNKYPDYLDNEISKHVIDLYIICKPDIPWIPDPLRENGGEKREYLMQRYIEEIKNTGRSFVFIGGTGDERFQNALNAVKSHFNLTI